MENNIIIQFLRYSSFVLLFIAISAQADDPEITPNYDNVEQKLKVFEIKSVLSINCNISKDNGYELTWEKNGTDVRKVESLKNRYEIREKERTFYIARAEQIDEGNYTCSIKSLNISKEIDVIADVYVRLQETTGVVEGEKLTITCQVAGTEPDVKWKIGDNLTISETTGRYIIEGDDEQHVPKAKLIIESAEESDRNNYYCSASNKATQYTNRKPALTKTYVRVKGKLAALWPFLGICAEVFILCAIILIYEKRRNKTELDESDTDPNTEQKNDHQGKDSDVRLRK